MSRFTVLPANQHRTMAWKNGGGLTTEIAIAPLHAGFDDFDWRVSMARIDVVGPFSTFPGVDRTLCVVEGEALLLHGLDAEAIRLTLASRPLSFPADRAVRCTPVCGSITDLNVMTRRGRYTHQVSRVAAGRSTIEGTGTVGILIASSPVDVIVDGAPLTLQSRDAVRIDGTAELEIGSASDPRTFLVVLQPARDG